jgi:hypothetical protein
MSFTLKSCLQRSFLTRLLQTTGLSLALMTASAIGVHAESVTIQGANGANGADGVNLGDNGEGGAPGGRATAVDGRRYSLASAAKDRAAWRAVQEHFPGLTEERCRAIIAKWQKNKLFETGEYEDPVRRDKAVGILSAKLLGDTDWASE